MCGGARVRRRHDVASMYAAYEALSDKMQRMLSDLIAIHDTTRTFSRANYFGAKEGMQVLSSQHPVVRTHPESGAKDCSSILPSPHQSKE